MQRRAAASEGGHRAPGEDAGEGRAGRDPPYRRAGRQHNPRPIDVQAVTTTRALSTCRPSPQPAPYRRAGRHHNPRPIDGLSGPPPRCYSSLPSSPRLLPSRRQSGRPRPGSRPSPRQGPRPGSRPGSSSNPRHHLQLRRVADRAMDASSSHMPPIPASTSNRMLQAHAHATQTTGKALRAGIACHLLTAARCLLRAFRLPTLLHPPHGYGSTLRRRGTPSTLRRRQADGQ
jgi:hypothetical protein